MDQQTIILFGGLTLAVAVSAYILWGPTAYRKKRKGQIVGLVNLGSTCFLNTLLQALASCAVFVEWLNQQKHEDGSLTAALHSVLWVLNGQGDGEVHAPTEVLTALKRHGWVVPSGEQDAHELFHVIVSTLQEEIKKTSKAGSISDALPISDTLSQTSDILDCPELPYEENGEDNNVLFKTENFPDPDTVDIMYLNSSGIEKGTDEMSVPSTVSCEGGRGDMPIQTLHLPHRLHDSSLESTDKFEDAKNHGDSESTTTTTTEFFSVEQGRRSEIDSLYNGGERIGGSKKEDEVFKRLSLGDEDETLKCKTDSKFRGKLEVSNQMQDLNKGTTDKTKLKAGQETLRMKSPDYSGCYDRVTGGLVNLPPLEISPFQGLLTSTLQCSACGHYSSLKYDTFDSLSLPLVDNCQIVTLQELLRKFVRTEIITDVDCERCAKKTAAFKTLNFGKLPMCLCLHVSRTTWQSLSCTPTKREDYVDFPEYLPLDDYTKISNNLKRESSTKLPETPTSSEILKERTFKHLYRLKSVVVHVGGVNSGHFLTYRRGALNTCRRHRVGKLAGACMDSPRWYLTSDDYVKMSTLCKAMNSLAYMLFYEKCSDEIFLKNDNIENRR